MFQNDRDKKCQKCKYSCPECGVIEPFLVSSTKLGIETTRYTTCLLRCPKGMYADYDPDIEGNFICYSCD